MVALRYFLLILGGLFLWLFAFVTAHFIAKYIIRFLALNITNSNTTNIGCCKFEWDFALQIAAYSLYAIIFALILICIINIRKRYSDSKLINRVLLVIFIMSFPTHTFWGVASMCAGFGACSNGYYFNLIVPTIMSTNPLAISVSAFIAYKLAKFYVQRGG